MTSETTIEERCWRLARQHLRSASAIAFDGCHKIYILMDDAQVEEMRSLGYRDNDMVLASDRAVDEMLATLKTWFDQSCFLRFVSAVRTVDGDPNNGFIGIIEQGEL